VISHVIQHHESNLYVVKEFKYFGLCMYDIYIYIVSGMVSLK